MRGRADIRAGRGLVALVAGTSLAMLCTVLTLEGADAGAAQPPAPVAAAAAVAVNDCVDPGLEPAETPIVAAWGSLGVYSDMTALFPGQLAAAFYAGHGANHSDLCLARNSLASTQLAVTAGAAAATINGATAGDLTGPGGAVIPATDIRFAREGLASLHRLSDGSFRPDLLPRDPVTGDCTGDCRMFDALIPTVDPFTGTARAAYPETVPAGQTRAIWVDVLAREDATAGTYTGAISVTVNGSVTTVPLTVSVFNQTIPAYGSPEAAIQGTDIRTDFRVSRKADMGWMKFARYARLGLENRVSLWFDGSFGTTDAEWATVAPLLQGTDPAIRLPGSRLTSVSFVKGTVAGDIASMHSRLQSIGQTDKAYFWCDEVLPATCKTDAANARVTWPGLPVVAIPRLYPNGYDPLTHPNGAAGDLADLSGLQALVPFAPYVAPDADKPGMNPYAGQSANSRAPAFTAWAQGAPGRQFWSYLSCQVSGCGSDYTGLTVWSGWPSYAIDNAPTRQAAFSWQAARYGFTGEHYWSVNQCDDAPAAALDACLYATPGDAGQNGDGQLFYRSSQFGLAGSEVPLESIRLKRIRDGRQAYALLKIAEHLGAGAPAGVVTALFPEMGESEATTAAYTTARLGLLENASGTPVTTEPRDIVAVAGNASATVTWEAPLTIVGTFQHYRVFANGTDVGTTPSTSMVVSGLTNGTTYTFTVRAETSSGNGLTGTSNAVVPTSTAVPPSIPSGVQAVADDGQATVSWTASNPGTGGQITYRVRTGGQVVCETTATTCTVMGLMNGTSYAFTVSAMNAAGESPPSPPSAPVTPLLPQPQNLAAPAVNGAATYGGVVVATPGTWAGRWGIDQLGYHYQWQVDGVDLAGASSETFRPRSTDVGHRLRVVVTATGPGYRPGSAASSDTVVSAASVTFGETPASRDKRRHGVEKGRKIKLTFTMPVLADGGTVSATVAGITVASATVSGGLIQIVIVTKKRGLRVGKQQLVLKFLGVEGVAPAQASYPLKIKRRR